MGVNAPRFHPLAGTGGAACFCTSSWASLVRLGGFHLMHTKRFNEVGYFSSLSSDFWSAFWGVSGPLWLMCSIPAQCTLWTTGMYREAYQLPQMTYLGHMIRGTKRWPAWDILPQGSLRALVNWGEGSFSAVLTQCLCYNFEDLLLAYSSLVLYFKDFVFTTRLTSVLNEFGRELCQKHTYEAFGPGSPQEESNSHWQLRWGHLI